ncbi:MAG: LysM peptidoglycan-binding domain-containing protein [bacterium]|nr:LysM peptidoglycan-binding domain-containing protein [bacterium]
MAHHRLLKIFCLLIIGLGVMFTQTVIEPVFAQTNLLKDPGFENATFNVIADTSSTGGVLCTVPSDWGGWFTETPRSADWQNRQPTCTLQRDKANSFVRSGNSSHEFSRGQATFTAAIYQTVGVATGTNVVGQAYYVMNVGSGSTAQVRVGIDPNGGTNPFDSDIVWSSWGGVRRNTDGFGPLSVNATATGTAVTLFIYATQATPTDPNQVFIDDASLTVGGGGGAVASGTPLVPPTATPIPIVVANFVAPQGTQEDGSIVHTVVEGDTLAAIATAYRVPIERLRELNPDIGRGTFLFIGQRILVAPAPTPTPRGFQAPATATPRGFSPAMTATPSGNTNVTNTPAPVGATNTPASFSATNTPAPTLTTVPQTQGNSGPFVTPTPKGGSVVQPTATEEVVATEEPVTTEAVAEATQAVVEATEVVTEVIVQPTATIAPTNTEMPPAPVVEPTTIAMNPDTTVTGVCVSFFDDINRDRLPDAGETPIIGGVITLRLDGQDVSSFLTTGDPAPYCFTDLVAGNYVVVGSPPAGYGMTTPEQLTLRVQSGTQLPVNLGAAQGVVAPTVAVEVQPQQPVIVEQPIAETPAQDNSLLANIGIIILALAGFTLISGIIGTILISRRG